MTGFGLSAAVDDIAMFDQFTGSATMNSPVPNAAYHLTAAKVKAPELLILIDCEPLGPVGPIKAAFKPGAGKTKTAPPTSARQDLRRA